MDQLQPPTEQNRNHDIGLQLASLHLYMEAS